MSSKRAARIAILILVALLTTVVVGGRLLAQQVAQQRSTSQPPVAAPLVHMGIWLDGFHRRDGRPGEQMRATHYCAQHTPDLIQCTLFDGSGQDARLIGVEYVIADTVLRRLPEEERALWHSHAYEVTSGMLVAPGMSPGDEHGLMEKIAHTYGKTWHTWDASGALPLGRPMLMMSLTRDGQARPGLIDARDNELGVSAAEVRARRADIRPAPLLTSVDRGEGGLSCAGPPSGAWHATSGRTGD